MSSPRAAIASCSRGAGQELNAHPSPQQHVVDELTHVPLDTRRRQIPLVIAHLTKAGFELAARLVESFEGVHARHRSRLHTIRRTGPTVLSGSSLNAGNYARKLTTLDRRPRCGSSTAASRSSVASLPARLWAGRSFNPRDLGASFEGTLGPQILGVLGDRAPAIDRSIVARHTRRCAAAPATAAPDVDPIPTGRRRSSPVCGCRRPWWPAGGDVSRPFVLTDCQCD